MNRIKEEQQVVEQMIRLYCRKKEGNKELCPVCQELLQYATARLERCKFGENKPTCKSQTSGEITDGSFETSEEPPK